jgi:hypothetical protein
MDNIEVAAIAMPYTPASPYAHQIAIHTTITGQAVDLIETPNPAMTLVP